MEESESDLTKVRCLFACGIVHGSFFQAHRYARQAPTHVRARMGVWARVGVLRTRVCVRVEKCRGLGWRGGWCVFGLVDKSATKVARVGVQG